MDIGNLVVGLWDSWEVLHGVDWLETSWRGRGRPFRSLVIKSHLNMYILANWSHIVSILSLQLYLRTFRLGNERGSEEDQKSDLAMKVLQKLPFLAETSWGKGRMPKNSHQINQLLCEWQITRPYLLSSGLLLGADNDPCCCSSRKQTFNQQVRRSCKWAYYK